MTMISSTGNGTSGRRIQFTVPGEIRGQGRPRTRIVGQHAQVYDDPKDRSYKALIQSHAMAAMQKARLDMANPTGKGISVEIDCFIRTPKSMPKKNLEKAYRGEINPKRKPDLDNVAKAVLDAMNQVVYADDKEVTEIRVSRHYSNREWLSVRVTWEEERNAEEAIG